MPQPCKICKRADREAIDAALIEGRPSLRAIGTRYGVSKDSLLRHFRAHIPTNSDDDDGQADEEPDEARQAAEDSAEKKEPEVPVSLDEQFARLWEMFRQRA